MKIDYVITNLNTYDGGYDFHDHYIMDRYVNQWSDVHITLIQKDMATIDNVLIVRI